MGEDRTQGFFSEPSSKGRLLAAHRVPGQNIPGLGEGGGCDTAHRDTGCLCAGGGRRAPRISQLGDKSCLPCLWPRAVGASVLIRASGFFQSSSSLGTAKPDLSFCLKALVFLQNDFFRVHQVVLFGVVSSGAGSLPRQMVECHL